MKPNEYVDIAKEIATKAHDGQKRWGGEPYITHPEAVANAVTGAQLMTIAWLHDVLEDTDLTADDLRAAGIPESCVRSVEVLTKRDGETYCKCIERIIFSDDVAAMIVKLADIKHNLNGLKAGQRRDKYELAALLLGSQVNWNTEV